MSGVFPLATARADATGRSSLGDRPYHQQCHRRRAEPYARWNVGAQWLAGLRENPIRNHLLGEETWL